MTRMKKWLTLFLVLLTGCGFMEKGIFRPMPEGRTLTVFADSSLTDAFSELETQFEANHAGVDVIFNFGGTETLGRQILESVPADVFASANQAQMEALIEAGLIEAGAPVVFTTNMMAVILPEGNPAAIDSLEQLAQQGIKIIMTAGQVPAGQYTRSALKNMNSTYGEGFDQKVLGNVISNEENGQQVQAKILKGEADVGFVYLSDTLSAPNLQVIIIPAHYGGIVRYPAAVLKNTHEPGLAGEFVQALLSDEMQATLRQRGFGGKEP